MNMKRISIAFLPTLALLPLSAQTKITLQADQAKERINPEIYGHFAEHLGRLIYGGILVEPGSQIDNIRGFRTDVIGALRDMKVPILRWPGGCFADTYNWRDGIGPKQNRPSIVNIHWGGVTEDNSFGTHEFFDFCELIGAEPYVNLNVGSGTVREAAQWVEYITSNNPSPMTNLRKENGRDKPWDIKYFCIGNENWGCGGHMTPEYYADLYRNYATYCGGVKYKIAGGPNVDDYRWTEVLMNKTQHHKFLMQGLSLHYYTFPGRWEDKGSSIVFDEQSWHQTLRHTLRMQELISKHGEIMDKYDPKKQIGLIVDEWGTWYDVMPGTNPGFLYQQNTLRDALVAGINLNIFNNNADRVKMANIAQMVNVLQAVILTQGDEMILTPTYYVFKMYNVHHGATLIPMNIQTQDYVMGDQKIPMVNASASIKDKTVSVTLCNLHASQSTKVEIDVTGFEGKTATGQIITGEKITDYNDFGKPEMVGLKAFNVAKPKGNKLTVEIPAKSVVLVQMK
uniref:non-reducing end alpha-L-arabinofuranosidase n=1 Tax=Breznakibacter xylanolyticus TaxID=990 RepID=O68278_9BACT|nr:ArfI [Breznakibacter xylanolyticus]